MQKSAEVFSIKAIDYARSEPCVIRETAHWAVVYKPPRLPTAPLRAEERNTLVYWFLHNDETRGIGLSGNTQINAPSDDMQRDVSELPADYGQRIQEVRSGNKREIETASIRVREAQVHGKKAIEAGLLHRLDTDTRGLVLFAKEQAVYDFLAARQEAGQIIKTYCAFVEPNPSPIRADNGYGFDITDLSAIKGLSAAQEKIAAQLPRSLESQFRNFGPGAKRVAPVFSGSRHYKKDGRLYTTVVESVDILLSPSLLRVRCRLSRGYRHQVRAHLAAAGLPIVGDPLYAPQEAQDAHRSLQLYAVSLEFPDPENPRQNICVALPPPDKMNP